MNMKPNTSGIDRRWEDGFDNRVDLLRLCPEQGKEGVDSLFSGLVRLVKANRRIRLVGFGVFEWKPWCNRLPTGKKVKAWHLSFTPSRYAIKYSGD